MKLTPKTIQIFLPGGDRPSRASVALQRRAGNGWNEWKDKNGSTLNEMKKTVDGAGM